MSDNDFWRDVVAGAVGRVRADLGAEFEIDCQSIDNAAEALASVPATEKSFAIAGGAGRGTKTLVIADLCLPADPGHARAIRDALEGRSNRVVTPAAEHGLALIRELSGYSGNVPVIVYSTVDSIGDRKALGYCGVADEDFLVKGVNGEGDIVRAVIRKIEKKSKYVIEKREGPDGTNRFRINGIPIHLPGQLERTFSAVYEICQRTGGNEFTVQEVISARGDSSSATPKKAVQDQIYRIRNNIHQALRDNLIYVDARDLIRTTKSPDGGDYSYHLNAEVVSVRDEAGFEDDYDAYLSETCKVLVVDPDPGAAKEAAGLLEELGYGVRCANSVEEAVRAAQEFLPHVVSVDLQLPYAGARTGTDEFAGLDAWNQIRTALNTSTLGVVVPTVHMEKSDLVAKAAQSEIPLRNFVSKLDPKWLNRYLTTVYHERRKVFLGEKPDVGQFAYEPVLEILEGSDLARGVLIMTVDGRPVTMKVSQKAKIVGLLLERPRALLSFGVIKSRVGGSGPVSVNDVKNWPKRIKDVIERRWLTDQPAALRRRLAEHILESSSASMQLNAHVIDLRR